MDCSFCQFECCFCADRPKTVYLPVACLSCLSRQVPLASRSRTRSSYAHHFKGKCLKFLHLGMGPRKTNLAATTQILKGTQLISWPEELIGIPNKKYLDTRLNDFVGQVLRFFSEMYWNDGSGSFEMWHRYNSPTVESLSHRVKKWKRPRKRNRKNRSESFLVPFHWGKG